MTDALQIRPACADDVNHIYDILEVFAKEKLLLPRPHLDILERIGNFRVAEVNGVFAGCAALRNYGNDLYEVRSLAVAKEFQNGGIASALVNDQIRSLREKKDPRKTFCADIPEQFFQAAGI